MYIKYGLHVFLFQGSVIENLSRRCGGFLRKLSLRGCQSIGDASMKTLASYCNYIEDINLEGCKKITDKYVYINYTVYSFFDTFFIRKNVFYLFTHYVVFYNTQHMSVIEQILQKTSTFRFNVMFVYNGFIFKSIIRRLPFSYTY